MLTLALASLTLALGHVNDGAPAGAPDLAAGGPPWAAVAQDGHVVVRSFADGRWTTRGVPLGAAADAPAIDFAGPRRTVPVVAWTEAASVSAARFDGTAWVPMESPGAGRTPSLAGGATTAGTVPAPWVAWVAPAGGHDQIFVSRGVKDAPWVPAGLARLGAAATLNISPARDAAAPDLTFAGPDYTTPWVTWQEAGKVFAARADEAGSGFAWEAVGGGTTARVQPLDTTPGCASSRQAEAECSLNTVPANAAGEPRIAAGPRAPGGIAVPWVVWSEDTGAGRHAIFLARLISGNHFEPANDGRPLSGAAADATAPDIAFSGAVPYITWQQDGNTVAGHLSDAGFVVDGSLPGSAGRAPIASGCPANPLTADGTNCPGVGTPFLLQPTGGDVFGAAYGAAVTTGDADAGGHATATVDPGGATIAAHFEYGPTTAYGARTADVRVSAAGAFGADLTGLPAGTTIHYRAVAQTDFGTVAGEDRMFATIAAIPADPGGGAPSAVAAAAPPATPGAPAVAARRSRTVPGALDYRFRWRGPVTRFTRLRLRGLPPRAHVRVTCTGRGCPDGRVRLKRLVGRRLRPGAVIEIRLTRAGMKGVLVQLTTRRANDPVLTTRSI